VYVPGIRSVTVYVPEELVTVWLATWVAVFVTVIFTLGITPPVASVTVPVIELRAWPLSVAGEVRHTTQVAKQAANKRQLVTLARCNSGNIEKPLMYGSLSKAY
jgi:hypothetical protein